MRSDIKEKLFIDIKGVKRLTCVYVMKLKCKMYVKLITIIHIKIYK